MTRNPLASVLAFATISVLTSPAFAAEHKIDCATLPTAVQSAVRQQTAGATLKGCISDVTRSRTTYEAETEKDGKTRDITFSNSGQVLEIEQEVDRESLPVVVASAIFDTTRGGRLRKIESLTRGGEIVRYEASYTRRGRSHEVAFTPEGRRVQTD